jgi:hypothetical protein
MLSAFHKIFHREKDTIHSETNRLKKTKLKQTEENEKYVKKRGAIVQTFFAGEKKSPTFAVHSGSDGRVARHGSAKPFTPVRIRFRPHFHYPAAFNFIYLSSLESNVFGNRNLSGNTGYIL